MGGREVETELPSRIQLMIHGLAGGGSERQMACLANALVRHPTRPAVQLMTLGSPAEDRYFLEPTISRVGLGLTSPESQEPRAGGLSRAPRLLKGLLANRRRVQAIRRETERWRPDVVVSFCDFMNIVALQALSGRFPIAISERSDPRKQKLSTVWEWLRDRNYPRADLCVVQSDSVGEYLKKRYYADSPGKLITIPSAIEVPEIDWEKCSESRNANSPKVCLYLGRFSAEKRLDRLLKAWSKLATKHPDWILKLVGEGREKESLESLANGLGIAHRVEWHNWVADVWSEWRGANLFVLSSDYEGFPQSLLEGLSAGLPAVVTDSSPSIRTLFQEGSLDGLVGSEDDFSEKLDKAMSSEGYRCEEGNRGRKIAEQYRWETTERQWFQAIAAIRR